MERATECTESLLRPLPLYAFILIVLVANIIIPTYHCVVE